MVEVLLLTPTPTTPARVLGALDFLPHTVKVLPMEPAALLDAPAADVILLDARRDLATARATARLLHSTGLAAPLVLILTEGGLPAVTSEWAVRDVIVAGASPAEVDARIRLATTASPTSADGIGHEEISAGDLVIDPAAYTVRLRGRPLDLTYKEFELLRHLAQHPGRVFTRTQLLQEVWGYDYYGGTRTVDVHVRRLRAKLGPEYEMLIGTVRNVGYRFDTPLEREPGPVGQRGSGVTDQLDPAPITQLDPGLTARLDPDPTAQLDPGPPGQLEPVSPH